MRPRWFHSRWESTLRSDRALGHAAKVVGSGWNAYACGPQFGYLGRFDTRASAMRAVASATDPRKGYLLG